MSLKKRVAIAKLEAKPALYRLEADAGERQALAELNKLVALELLAGEIELKRLDGGRIRLEGRIQANLTQRCVVSLEPVAQVIDAAFHYDFGTVGSAIDAENGEVLIDMESDVEPLPGDSLELGDILAEQLTLAIDPYPRAPGAQLQAPPTGPEQPVNPGKSSPFAALAALKPKG